MIKGGQLGGAEALTNMEPTAREKKGQTLLSALAAAGYSTFNSSNPRGQQAIMASIASSALRTGLLGSSSSVATAVATAATRTLPRTAAAAASRRLSRRGYVTESKRDSARVETAIKLDKKDFADVPPPQVDTPSNAKVSPMARKS